MGSAGSDEAVDAVDEAVDEAAYEAVDEAVYEAVDEAADEDGVGVFFCGSSAFAGF